MTIHLYQRTITSKGKKVKAWYYWFYDENGKQVRKSCGQNGKPCLLKRDAQAFIERLKDEDINASKIPTFNEYCKGFYNEDSIFIKKMTARGYHYQPKTIRQKSLYLEKFLFAFGDQKVNSITTGDIENWLISLDIGNSSRNSIMTVIEEVESELYAARLIDYLHKLRHFKRNTREKGILSIAEIQRLFPDDYETLIKIWQTRYETENETYSFATMIYTMLSTGMRSSEIRALQWNQFIRRDAILINAMIDSNNERVNRLKKWTNTNKKWRVSILPDRTTKMLEIIKLDKAPGEFVFTYKDKPLSDDYMRKHFKRVLLKNNIDCKTRNITIHSMRFTYNSLLRGEISDEDLRLMIGHTKEAMTEYYDKTTALQHLDSLLLNKDSLNTVFN